MPRLIDHAQRHRDIGDAAARVLARDGIAALSVRKVAEEAGLATASLRRAFPTQAALRQFCLDRIQSDVVTRIRALTGEGQARAVALLCELLPLDETRRVELTVQVQLGSLALTDADLEGHVRELHDGVRAACAAALAELDRVTPLLPGTDLALETARLHGLLDGLALHMLWQRQSGAREHAVAVLDFHLSTLTISATASAHAGDQARAD
jgi:AcrR family transcriptional regulator